MYLRNARNCYDRWGADGKVKQLDERYPRLHEERLAASTTATIGTPVRSWMSRLYSRPHRRCPARLSLAT